MEQIVAMVEQQTQITIEDQKYEDAYYRYVKDAFSRSKAALTFNLGTKFNQYSDFNTYRESSEYESLDSKIKTALTRATNNVNKTGLQLLLPTPHIVSNVLLAYNMGLFEQYAKIMMSSEAYKALLG